MRPDGAPEGSRGRQVTVIGCDGSPLTDAARGRLAAATLVVGAPRHLEAVPVPEGAAVRQLTDVTRAVAEVAGHDGPCVLLASGDPGFFGIVRRLAAAGIVAEVHPAVSSVALAFARAGLSWDDAVVTSAHGRDLRPAVHACAAHPKVAVLTGPGAGPAQIGQALVDLGAAEGRRLLVAEDLGTPVERCRWVTPAAAAAWTWSDLAVVICLAGPVGPGEAGEAGGAGGAEGAGGAADLDPAPAGWLSGPVTPAGWALPDEAFEHRDGMVTKAEVRAVALARLGPRTGDLVWDIGTGSGSVAVECARFGAAVVAVDRDGTQLAQRNAARHGVSLIGVTGAAPEVLRGLPDPDAVFVGGGGADVGAITADCVARGPRTVVVALAALERLAAVRSALAPYAVEGVQVSAARLRDLGPASGLAATNPVLLVWGTRP